MYQRFGWLFLAISCTGKAPDDEDGGGTSQIESATATGLGGFTGDTSAAASGDTGVTIPCADEIAEGLPATVVGTTLGQGDHTPSTCDPSDPLGADDWAIAWIAPADGKYAFTTARATSDPNLVVYDGCGGQELGCSYEQGSKGLVTAALTAGQTAIVVLDGGDDFQLDVYAVRPSEFDCTDELDDDADRVTDCLDPDCSADPACVPTCPDLVSVGAPVTISGSTVGKTDDYTPKCNIPYVSGPTSDTSVAFTAPSSGSYGVQLAGHGFTPRMALRDGCTGRELGCSFGAPLGVTLVAGQTAVVDVDGWYRSLDGAFTVDFFPLEATETSCTDGYDNDLKAGADCQDPACDSDPICGEDCTNGIDDDGDGATDCVDSVCGTDAACVESACSGGADEDGDGAIDCADPDCDVDSSCTEICNDQNDDDLDGAIDCMDGGCAGDPSCVVTCPQDTLVSPGMIVGTTVGRGDRVTPSCKGTTAPASDWSVGFTAPATGRYLFDTVGSTAYGALVVTRGCGGPEIGCDDPLFGSPARVAVDLVAGQTAVAVVDSYAGFGTFQLNAAEIDVEEVACNDGLDDDVDGDPDCFDADCVFDPICAENCADGLDDNGNGDIDYADPVCHTDSGCASVCPEGVLAGPLPLQIAGSTVGATADRTATCGNGAPGSDTTWAFQAPSTAIYRFDTVGSSFDTVLSVLDGCAGATLACNDDTPGGTTASAVDVLLREGQTVIVVIDSYDDDGSWVLNVR